MVNITRGAAIVGIHEHITRYAPDKSELQLQGESIIKAVEDAGLTKNDVDGLFTASMSIRNSGLALADYLNMYPKMVDNTTVGGGSFEFHLSHALNAIAAGRINCAVITRPITVIVNQRGIFTLSSRAFSESRMKELTSSNLSAIGSRKAPRGVF